MRHLVIGQLLRKILHLISLAFYFSFYSLFHPLLFSKNKRKWGYALIKLANINIRFCITCFMATSFREMWSNSELVGSLQLSGRFKGPFKNDFNKRVFCWPFLHSVMHLHPIPRHTTKWPSWVKVGWPEIWISGQGCQSKNGPNFNFEIWAKFFLIFSGGPNFNYKIWADFLNIFRWPEFKLLKLGQIFAHFLFLTWLT